MNILIVDDIQTNRKLLRVVLEAEGHHILEATDGVEGLTVLMCDKVDAVISDHPHAEHGRLPALP